ncbi:hypothetical protein BU24DRAFT_54813 [Aaosphaeria arxii CBS 175.79]|uniref:Zn(2)-C6 fungal-type domain-containing protein n=1 Tax=Aaosphaeria arxii CBS 175.79 TaxID=1450172 RepID=A0A6A5XE79_9PLEO|nr:uncharacterized protein BU24DRAFT_54813 [Aaosphaeria arxii CBS 175.79]KAF2011189.1 hypothetical protein BU24DRAFT_54813 [Aaosphaeria arxii CBS 175.79]
MEKPQKTRKPHKKSRNGCLPCKARHVKCDERKPTCATCDKYDSICEYPLPKKRLVSEPPISTPSSADGSTANHQTPMYDQALVYPTDSSSPNMAHLRLLHHYTTVTAPTLAADDGAVHVYSSLVVHIALEFPFLMEAIFALAALHLGRLDMSKRAEYLRQAESHHDRALNLFRNLVQDIEEYNFQAVLLFAGTLFPYSCAIPIDMQHRPDYMLESILQTFALIRRTRPMVATFYRSFLASEIGRIVPQDTRVDWDKEDQPEQTELVKLRKFSEIIEHIFPSEIVEAYVDAIRKLEIIFARVANLNCPPSDSLIKLWVHFVSSRFMELLSERQPGALIIFAHYAVLFHRSQQYWFLHGVADQVMHIADNLVPSEWKGWLDWPKEQIGMAASPNGPGSM